MQWRTKEGKKRVCAQPVWLQTTFLTDESDDEDDEDVAKMGNLFDDLQQANLQLETQTNMLVQYKDKLKLWKEKGKANNVKGCANGFRFMDGYRKGLTGPVLEYAVKKSP